MVGISKQIFGSFEDIGKDIAREVAHVPKDIAGKALESFGTASTNKTQSQIGSDRPKDSRNLESGAFGDMDKITSKHAKALVARAALQQLAGHNTDKQEPRVWEEHQRELEQKKTMSDQQKTAARFSSLPVVKGKRPRGNLFGISEKQSSEKGKNTRQD